MLIIFFPEFPEGHKCRALHGQTYRLRVFIKGSPLADTGWLLDFNWLKKKVTDVLDPVDHHFLNDVPGLKTQLANCLPFGCGSG